MDAERRFFRWCWNQLTQMQRDAMLVVATTAAPNGSGLSALTRQQLERAGMIKVEAHPDHWLLTFTDLGESVMHEGATIMQELDAMGQGGD